MNAKMKKEEFPTFLNEQPTIIFGRTGRELLIIAIGLGMAYITWLRLGEIIHGNSIEVGVVKAILSAIVVVIAGGIAFANIATRPVEEWAFVWLFYALIPKVYLYLPEEEGEPASEQSSAKKKDLLKQQANADDDFADD